MALGFLWKKLGDQLHPKIYKVQLVGAGCQSGYQYDTFFS